MKKKLGRLRKKIKNNFKKLLKNLLLSKTFYKIFQYTLFVGLFVVILFSLYFYLHQTIGKSVIVSESEILNRVGKQVVLPKDGLISVTRVQDAQALRSQNDFYKDIEEGNYIIIYKNEIIIYDFMGNKVTGVKQ